MQPESWMEPEIFSGICYHGTCINKKTESVFEELKEEYSDFDAIWVTPDEDVAEIFAKDNRRDVENPVILVFKLKVQLESMAVILDNEYWRDFRYNYECDYDLRDCISVLRNMGFDSWYTAGAVNQTFYDDIAIFGYGTKAFISHVKFLGPSGHWSSYIPIEKAIQEDFFKTTDPVYQTIKDEIIEQGQLSEETVEALYKKIIGILIRQFKNQLSREERHDVAVDSVSNFLRTIDQGNYDPNKAVSSYIKIIAKNLGIKALDRQKRQIDLIDTDPEKTDVFELLGEIDDRVEYEDLLAAIEQTLQRYDQNQATRKNAFTDMTGLFNLILQGYTTKEIADVYNITPEWTRQLKINLAQILNAILRPKTTL